MNYDLFIPASATSGSSGSVVPAAQFFGNGQETAVAGAARSQNASQAPLRPPQGSASEQLSTQEVQNTVDAFNEVFTQANVSVRYSFDQKTHDLVIKLVDSDTNEVLRQMPPDQILKMRQRLEEVMGLMFDGTA